MIIRKLLSTGLLPVAVGLFMVGCNDEISPIGPSITQTEVSVRVDSLEYALTGHSIPAPDFATRSDFTLIGALDAKDYGQLTCSYVTRLLPAESLAVPDSINGENVDSVKMILDIPRSKITGSPATPQQLKVFSLTKALPEDITASFDPEGYYNPSPLGTRSFTLASYTSSDGSTSSSSNIRLAVNLPAEIGREAFDAYRTTPDLFVWPAKFAQKWPGLYIAPTFGQGCVAAVSSSKIYAYYPKHVYTREEQEDGSVKEYYKAVADSVCLFSTAPEVLASVNVSYTPSSEINNLIAAGNTIITTPGGYAARFTFPANEILDEYWTSEYNLGVINNMTFAIPAYTVPNSLEIGVPPNLLMVKTSQLEEFFAEGKVPDDLNSFYSVYSASEKLYRFNSMRQYIVALRAKGKENILPEDLDFTLVPVSISTEEATLSNGSSEIIVTKVVPYLAGPSMTQLDIDHARIVFTFSSQTID